MEGSVDSTAHLLPVAEPDVPAQRWYPAPESTMGIDVRLDGLRVIVSSLILDIIDWTAPHSRFYNGFTLEATTTPTERRCRELLKSRHAAVSRATKSLAVAEHAIRVARKSGSAVVPGERQKAQQAQEIPLSFLTDIVPSWRNIRPRIVSPQGALRSKLFADPSVKSTGPMRLAASLVKPQFFLVADLKDAASDALALSIPKLDAYLDMAASGDMGIVADIDRMKALRVGQEQFRPLFKVQSEAYSAIMRAARRPGHVHGVSQIPPIVDHAVQPSGDVGEDLGKGQ